MDRPSPKYSEIKEIYNRHADAIDKTLSDMNLLDSVHGMGIGWDRDKWAPYLDLSIRDETIVDKFPKEIDGLAVVVTVRKPPALRP